MNNFEEIKNSIRNNILDVDQPFHNWYNFVLSYPPHLVRHYINRFNINPSHIVFDPFSGTGTTPIECMKNDIKSIGMEANDVVLFVSKIKSCYDLDPDDLSNHLAFISYSLIDTFRILDIYDNYGMLFLPRTNLRIITLSEFPELDEEKFKLIPNGFINPIPLKKILLAKQIIKEIKSEKIRDFFLLSLIYISIKFGSNISFGPEIYKKKIEINDFDFLSSFVNNSLKMINDIKYSLGRQFKKPILLMGDSRKIDNYLNQDYIGKIDFIITSPPYPNEKDYTRSTRLESILLDFVNSKKELRELKTKLLRSNSRNIFVNDNDSEYVKDIEIIQNIANNIEKQRLALNKTSGFERLYHKIVQHYFGGMYLHLKSLKPFLSKDAKLAYVVGDQASFFQIHIPTADILAIIAKRLGYKVLEIELFRTRLSTKTKKYMSENVLILINK